MTEISKYLDQFGLPGTRERLKAIAAMDLGQRSEAARSALLKRARRLELREKGFSYEEVILIVNRDQEVV